MDLILPSAKIVRADTFSRPTCASGEPRAVMVGDAEPTSAGDKLNGAGMDLVRSVSKHEAWPRVRNAVH